MPEGDTVYRAARRLDQALSGQTIVTSQFRVPSLATRDLAGATVTATVPRGKHLLTRLDNGATIHSHLRMEGRWDTHPVGSRWRRPGHQARVVLRTGTTEAVGFLVLVDLVPTAEEDRLVGHLGPDLLGPDWNPDEALRRLNERPGAQLADALREQRNLAGIGNVFAVELCFLAGRHPAAPVSTVADLPKLVDTAYRLLQTNKDRADRVTTGVPRPGRKYWVYKRQGPCLRCGTRIEQATLGELQREVWWCPSCQPLPG